MEISGTLINLYREREKKGRSGGVMVRDDEGVKKQNGLFLFRERKKKKSDMNGEGWGLNLRPRFYTLNNTF